MFTTFTCGAVELTVAATRERATYCAKLRHDEGEGSLYALVPDDGPGANYDPVDHWHAVDSRTGDVGDRLGSDPADEALRVMLDRAAMLMDKIRPGTPVANISEPMPDGDAGAILEDDDFNRLADEVATCCPGVEPSLLYVRALRLKGLESGQPEQPNFGLLPRV